MSAVIDIAKDIAESVRKHGLHVEIDVDIDGDESCSSVDVYGDGFQYIATLWCDTNEEAARVVALARGEK